VLAQDYTSGRTYTLDGLSPGTTYNISVTASTGSGEGTAAMITSTTTFGGQYDGDLEFTEFLSNTSTVAHFACFSYCFPCFVLFSYCSFIASALVHHRAAPCAEAL